MNRRICKDPALGLHAYALMASEYPHVKSASVCISGSWFAGTYMGLTDQRSSHSDPTDMRLTERSCRVLAVGERRIPGVGHRYENDGGALTRLIYFASPSQQARSGGLGHEPDPLHQPPKLEPMKPAPLVMRARKLFSRHASTVDRLASDPERAAGQRVIPPDDGPERYYPVAAPQHPFTLPYARVVGTAGSAWHGVCQLERRRWANGPERRRRRLERRRRSC